MYLKTACKLGNMIQPKEKHLLLPGCFSRPTNNPSSTLFNTLLQIQHAGFLDYFSVPYILPELIYSPIKKHFGTTYIRNGFFLSHFSF